MLNGLFSSESIQEALSILQTEIPFAIWESFYVTVLSTALAIVIDCLWACFWSSGKKAASAPCLPGF